MPSDGKPEHELPFTPEGRKAFMANKPTFGTTMVPSAASIDPVPGCDPQGFPRMALHNFRTSWIMQNPKNIVILYEFNKKWRTIWTDGRSMPKLVDGGVEIDGKYREPRWLGYSVGKWIDDYTLEVVTVGMMPEDRVWLDNTGRPISDQAKVTETFRRLSDGSLEWSETIEDPKMYTKPWQTMKLPLTKQNGRIDLVNRYCSPAEIDAYNEVYGNPLSGK